LQIVKKSEKGVIVKLLSDLNPKEVFEKAGHTPIPPYMKRDDTEEDFERYNTVFGKYFGSVASPTASLNLTEDLLEKIKKKGIKIAKVELKVGWGTFAPVREENIEDHEIHEEEISLSLTSADIINETIKNGGDVWVFGTTVARLLESCATKDGFVEAYEGSTNLYIYPGYEWKIVNHLITNFHMPDSSLILLVSSFAGKELIKKAYDEALENEYMLLSYGDSMLII
jgi:S-adenosylmethionine:tRNA ribosyltransferase-isomerase